MRAILLLLMLPLSVSANVLMDEDGATCNIPPDFNTGPYDPLYNRYGMTEFCVFPHVEELENFWSLLSDLQSQADGVCPQGFTDPTIPLCNRLVVSPSIGTFPCYELRTE